MNTIKVNAETCFECWGVNSRDLPLVTLDAVFETELRQGMFYNRVYREYFIGEANEVIAITGFFNETPIILRNTPEGVGWLAYGNYPMNVGFNANGQQNIIFWDGGNFILTSNINIPLHWRTSIIQQTEVINQPVQISEIASFWLMFIPLIFLLLFRRKIKN